MHHHRFFCCSLGLALLLSPRFAASQATATPQPAAALSALFKEIWEDQLKSSPEFASALGDRRYNDQLTDISPRAINDELARRRNFLARLSSIDTTGLSAQQKLSAEFIQGQLIADEQSARLKQWELPVNQFHGIQADLPAEVVDFPFDTVKDYDDYIARLHKIQTSVRQASENMLSGVDDHRVQPADVLDKVLAQADALANQTPEASPFALPLKRFPTSIDAPTRKRITSDLLEAIQTDVQPAYARLAKFVRVVEIPAAGPAADPNATSTGQPLSYQSSQWKILELKAKTQTILGQKFNLKAFHDLVADSSALPADMLQQRVDAWIAANK